MSSPRLISGVPLRGLLAWVALVAVAGIVVGLRVATLGGPVTLDGLAAPRGLTALADGSLLIAEGGAGRLLRWDPGGDPEVVTEGLPYLTVSGIQGESASGVSAAIQAEPGVYYAVVGEARAKGHQELYRIVPPDTPLGVTGQDVLGLFPPNLLTNPYDLVCGPAGSFLVTDSGRNEVLLITEGGDVSTFAPLPPIETGEGPVEPVPTGAVSGPDGALYVATLTGWPHPAGAASVYRVADDGSVGLFASGFSAATDLVFEQGGALLVTEFSSDMQALVEDLTAARAQELPGRLVRWRDGVVETVADDLVSPTAVAVVDGRIFVSEEFAGRVREIGVTSPGWAWGLVTGLGAGLAATVLALAAGYARARTWRAGVR